MKKRSSSSPAPSSASRRASMNEPEVQSHSLSAHRWPGRAPARRAHAGGSASARRTAPRRARARRWGSGGWSATASPSAVSWRTPARPDARGARRACRDQLAEGPVDDLGVGVEEQHVAGARRVPARGCCRGRSRGWRSSRRVPAGNSDSTSSRVPSVEALSTTITSRLAAAGVLEHGAAGSAPASAPRSSRRSTIARSAHGESSSVHRRILRTCQRVRPRAASSRVASSTRSTASWSDSHSQQSGHALLERRRRLEAEQLARALSGRPRSGGCRRRDTGRCGSARPRAAARRPALARSAGPCSAPGAEVDRVPGRGFGLERQQDPAHDVADVDEVARLRAVLEDHRRRGR